MELPLAKELDYTETWVNSIDKEVLKGTKVRDEKLKSLPSNSIYEYDLVDIDFNKPSCSKSYESSRIQRPLKSRKNRNSHRSVSPQKIKKKYKKLKKHKHKDGMNTCGMRIAELAVPSKRHCIDTWRNNWDTLPTLMVDRLRQIVMDQKPIVPIQDAIICFKQKRTSRSPNKGNKVKNKRNREIKLLSGLFGFRISAELQDPCNVTIASHLIPISHVVNDEISRLLAKRKISNLQKNIQLEIANKITNWIGDILEQSTYNLMQEDYIELEKEEGHIWDIVDDLVDNAALLSKVSSNSSSDVIEESSDLNPSLIGENTSASSESDNSDNNNLIEFENIISNIIEKITNNNINRQDIDPISQENINDIEEFSTKSLPENIESYFKNFLFNYIDEIIFDDADAFEDAIHLDDSDPNLVNKSFTNDGIENTVQNSEKENSDKEIIETNNEPDIGHDFNKNTYEFENALTDDVYINEALKESSSMNNNRNSTDIMEPSFIADIIPKEGRKESLPQDNEDTIAVITDNEIDNINDKIEETNLRIDETIPLTDITSDDSIKKVKNSNIYMDSGQGQLNIKSNIKYGDNKKNGSQGIHFAPPNVNLLSDADESWPENLRFPIVKATISVSKSVMSLGKITEGEEKIKYSSSVEERYIKEINAAFNEENANKSIDEKLTNKDFLPVTKDVRDNNNIESDKVQKKYDKVLLNIDHSIEIENIINENLNKNSRSVIEEILKTKTVEKGEEIVPNISANGLLKSSQSNEKVVNKDFIDTNILQTPQEGGGVPTELKDKAIETTNINNKRRPVNLSVELMPSISIYPEIYLPNLQRFGDAFKRNEITQTKPFKNCQCKSESEVRLWCQGLQNVVKNLDMWLNWIDSTCSNLLYLKQKEKFLSCNRKIEKHDIRKWIILKTNIDADARLWEKLSISLQVGLRSYKRFYHQNESQFNKEIGTNRYDLRCAYLFY